MIKDMGTKQIILELATRGEIEEILVVSGEQEYKIKIGADSYEFSGPAKILIIKEEERMI